MTKTQMLAHMDVAMGGRVAEELGSIKFGFKKKIFFLILSNYFMKIKRLVRIKSQPVRLRILRAPP